MTSPARLEHFHKSPHSFKSQQSLIKHENYFTDAIELLKCSILKMPMTTTKQRKI
jgi:hypothetical protein